MNGTFLFLGTGASAGVPIIGCGCKVCNSDDERNRRLRPAGLVRIGGKTLLIDIGPDFRQQALRCGLTQADGLLLTHTHYDHIAGIDELRVLNYRQKKPFPCLLSKESYADLQRRYYYLFEQGLGEEIRAAQIDCKVLPSRNGKVDFLGLPIQFVSFRQAGMEVTGFRIGTFAYISDIREYDDEIFESLKGVKTLVLSSLRAEASKVHLCFDEAVAFADRVGAKKTWLTHLSHGVDHEEACRMLPPSVQPGYDGLEFSFEAPHA